MNDYRKNSSIVFQPSPEEQAILEVFSTPPS